MRSAALFLTLCLVPVCSIADTVTKKTDERGNDVIDSRGDVVFVVDSDPELVTTRISEGSRRSIAELVAVLAVMERLFAIQRELAVLQNDEAQVDKIDFELPRISARKVRLESAIAAIDAMP